MWVFYILLLVPLMIQHVSIKGYKISYRKKNEQALLFFFIFLTILVMFRHESVGSDTDNYIYYFKRISRLSWKNVGDYSLEFGFVYLNKIVSLVSKEPQVFFSVVAIAISAMIYPVYKRLCVDASLTIALFCVMSTFVMMFSGIRQMLAVGVGFFAYEATRKKKLFLFVLSVVIAVSFHTSAFMLAFMYPLYYMRITKKWLLAVVPILVVMFLFNRQIFTLLALVLERYTKYDVSITRTGAYTMLLVFAAFIAYSFLIPEESIIDRETMGLRNFLLFSFALQMFAPLHTIAMRMNYYYIIFIPLLLPQIVRYRRERWSQIAVLSRHLMVVFFLIYFFINAYGGYSLKVFPYHFFWEVAY